MAEGATAVAAAGDESEAAPAPRDRRDRWFIAVALLPLVVSAVALVVDVGTTWMPTGDHAGTELYVRDIGRHEVLVGLWSRANWSHPGPLLFYLLAPFYWLTGGASIGLSIGALAVNGASVAGMAAVARRLGGVPLLLCTLLGCSLVMRTLGADFLHDPQNIYVPTLPLALLVFLTWAMACGETWALPAAAFVASFVAQTHVGFVVLAGPLLAFGAAWMVVSTVRSDRLDGRRRLARPGAAAVAILAVVWLPPLLDVVYNAPSNIRNIVEWFVDADEGVHTLGEGWRVITGQFGFPPESLTTKRGVAWGTGESPLLHSAPLPILLVPVSVAAVFLWRRAREGRALVATLALVLVLAIVSVTRTVGPALDYRLRWTWVPALVAFVGTGWAGWRAARDRWGPWADRVLTAAAAAGLVVVSAVNVVTAATAGTPHPDDSALVAALVPQLADAVGDGDGTVVVSDPFTPGNWYGRAIVLQLERRGVDARVDAVDALRFGAHRVHHGGRPAARLLVLRDNDIDDHRGRAGLRLVAEAESPWFVESGRSAAPRAELQAEWEAGRLSDAAYVEAVSKVQPRPPDGQTFAGRVAVFVDSRRPGDD